MKRGIMYVVHGKKEHQSQLNLDCINQVEKQSPEIPQTIAYLAGEEDTLEQKLVEMKDCDELVIVPLLLYAATHYLIDLPKRLTDVTARILPPLAQTPSFVQWVETAVQAIPDNDRIILLVHGTKHYAEPYQEQVTLMERLQQQHSAPITIADLHGDHPYQEILTTDDKVHIIPLFLTEGRLVKKVQSFTKTHTQNAIWHATLEGSPFLTKMLLEEVEACDVSDND